MYPLVDVSRNKVYTTDFMLNKDCSFFGEIYLTDKSLSTKKKQYSGLKCEIYLDRLP